jgi:hypothetical protein
VSVGERAASLIFKGNVMNWWKRYKERKAQPKIEEVETIDGWRLWITTNYGKRSSSYDHPELQNLWKIYEWYLTRDSEKYNVESKSGYEIIHRHDVVNMELKKIKLPKKDWVQENNDET